MVQAPTIDDRADHSRPAPCPTAAELSALADGRVPDLAFDLVVQHVSQCGRCEETVEALANESTLIRRLRMSVPARSRSGEPECQLMLAAARSIASPWRQAAEASQESTDSTRLSTDNVPHDLSRGLGNRETTLLPPPPTKIGRYQIRSLLGEGTYGRVYLATDPDLDRQVALKVPKLGVKSKELIEALLREARIAARLKHQGIVMIYDVGIDPEAGCFIAMEYVEGKSLKALAAAGRISHAEAARYVAQAAEAVHYAHKQNLVHRDLKPANLLIDAENRVKVADFGLAIFEEQQRSQAGEYAGTLAYSSPEQVRCEVQNLDGRTDIWSLGVILYELLTGRRPFGSKLSITSDEILHRPVKPPRQIDDTVPADLERICLKCLAKEASGRYSTAQDMADALSATISPSVRAPFRRSIWIGLSVAVATLLVAVSLLGLYSSGILKPAHSAARQDTEAAIPYVVDEIAVPGTWVRLLTQEPRTLFPLDPQAKNCLFTAAQESILMDTPGVYLVGLGKTVERNFELQVDVTKHAREGAFGFFLGFKPSSEHSNTRITQLVLVNYDGPEECTVQREVVRVITAANGSVGTRDRSMFAHKPVEPLRAEETRLEIFVAGGEIDRIAWRGEEFPDLRGKRTPDFMHYTDCVGEFGLINFSGTTTFQSPRFRFRSRSTP
jgi:serine/threonine protein kinase